MKSLRLLYVGALKYLRGHLFNTVTAIIEMIKSGTERGRDLSKVI